MNSLYNDDDDYLHIWNEILLRENRQSIHTHIQWMG